jgi:hypothetical protein
VAQYADFCNVGGDPATVAHKYAVLRQHCERVGRAYDTIIRSNDVGILIATNERELAAKTRRCLVLAPGRHRQRPRRPWASFRTAGVDERHARAPFNTGPTSREGAPLSVCRAALIAPWPCLATVSRHHASMPAWWSGGACAQHQVVAWCGSDCRWGTAGCSAWSRTRCCTGSRSRSCCAVHKSAHAMWRGRESQICRWHARTGAYQRGALGLRQHVSRDPRNKGDISVLKYTRRHA